jgi:hypothetical protein
MHWQNKKSIIEARMLLIHHKLEVNTPLLIEEPTKEYKFPIIERSFRRCF